MKQIEVVAAIIRRDDIRHSAVIWRMERLAVVSGWKDGRC